MTAYPGPRPRFARMILTIATMLLAIAPLASAAVTITPGADFNVAIDASEAVSVACSGSGGDVVVIVDGTANVTATPCSAVTSLAVAATGSGDNNISLQGVNSVDFTSLTTTTIDGGGGNDTLAGSALADTITGGDGDDTILGGRGNDVLLGSAGNDTFVWNPGDGSDTIEGGDGNDTLTFNGSNVSEQISIDANGSRLRLFRDIASITMDLDNVEKVDLKMLGGNDGVTIGDLTGVAGVNAISVSLDDGDDTIDASLQASPAVQLTVDGGAGDDVLTGSPQADVINGGDGNDTIVAGRGADVVFGGAGDDTLKWNPGDGSDTFEGGVGNDALVFNGSNVSENFTISANGTRVTLFRDVASITMDIAGVETISLATLGGVNSVTVNDLSGVADLASISIALGDSGDTVDASAQLNPQVGMNVQGGLGADRIVGGAGNDTIAGGRGEDFLAGSGGDDTFAWQPGDGSDTIEGGAGNDTLQFTGSNVSENMTLSANGERLRLFRDVAAITMDMAGIETVDVDMLGGVNTFTVSDLTGVPDVRAIGITLGDQADTVDASAQLNPAVAMTIRGGDGADHLTGGAGPDVIEGGRGEDVLSGSGGADTFRWNPGDGSDTIAGGEGSDTLIFSGSNVSESFAIARTPSGFVMTRDVASITMNVDSVEVLNLSALGGDDQVSTVGLPSTTQVLDGGEQLFADVLNVDAQNAVAVSGAGTITIAGSQPIEYSNFESVNLMNAVVPAANLTATKTVTLPAHLGGLVTYTIVVTNTGTATQPDNPGAELTDVLPSEVQLVSAVATAGHAVATRSTNTVTWNGALGSGASVTITIQAALKVGLAAGKTVVNQATVAFDADGNGTNESTRPSDDPTLPGSSDPTAFAISLPGHH